MDIVFNAMTDIYPEFDSDRMADQYYTEMYNSCLLYTSRCV